jgi:hypothetical protein
MGYRWSGVRGQWSVVSGTCDYSRPAPRAQGRGRGDPAILVLALINVEDGSPCHAWAAPWLRLPAAVGSAPRWGGIYSAARPPPSSTWRNEFRPTWLRLPVAGSSAPRWGGIYSAVRPPPFPIWRNEFRPTWLRLTAAGSSAPRWGGIYSAARPPPFPIWRNEFRPTWLRLPVAVGRAPRGAESIPPCVRLDSPQGGMNSVLRSGGFKGVASWKLPPRGRHWTFSDAWT